MNHGFSEYLETTDNQAHWNDDLCFISKGLFILSKI